MHERRKATRQRALKGARIVFNRHFSAIDCTIRNLSPRGALLQVRSPLGIPEQFDLQMDAGAVSHPCRVVWRDASRLGVVFG